MCTQYIVQLNRNDLIVFDVVVVAAVVVGVVVVVVESRAAAFCILFCLLRR